MKLPAASCGVSSIQNTEARSQEKNLFRRIFCSNNFFWMLDSGSWIPETKCRPVGTTFSRSKLRGNQPDKD
jgi:hypothetical protein